MTPQKDGASPTELLKPHQICYGQNQPKHLLIQAAVVNASGKDW